MHEPHQLSIEVAIENLSVCSISLICLALKVCVVCQILALLWKPSSSLSFMVLAYLEDAARRPIGLKHTGALYVFLQVAGALCCSQDWFIRSIYKFLCFGTSLTRMKRSP